MHPKRLSTGGRVQPCLPHNSQSPQMPQSRLEPAPANHCAPRAASHPGQGSNAVPRRCREGAGRATARGGSRMILCRLCQELPDRWQPFPLCCAGRKLPAWGGGEGAELAALPCNANSPPHPWCQSRVCPGSPHARQAHLTSPGTGTVPGSTRRDQLYVHWGLPRDTLPFPSAAASPSHCYPRRGAGTDQHPDTAPCWPSSSH